MEVADEIGGRMTEQKILIGNSLDVLKTIPDESLDVCITSPPYYNLRDYGDNTISKYGDWEGQLGLESTPDEYIKHLCMIFDEIKRVLKPSGACWVNISDTYNEEKTLCQIPSRFSISMVDHGWLLRNTIIWHKKNIMPSSAKDRFTNDYEVFHFFTKQSKYYFKQYLEPVKAVSLERAKYGFKSSKMNMSSQSNNGIDVNEMGDRFANPNGRNCRAVWSLATSNESYGHIAMFPMKLIEIPISTCCPMGGGVIDPFAGSGTVLAYCRKHNIDAIGIDINPDNEQIMRDRMNSELNENTERLDKWF